MIPHRPASPAEQVTDAPTTITATIDLQDHTAPSFLPYPGKGLSVDLLGCDFANLRTSSMRSAIDRGSQHIPHATTPKAWADAPIDLPSQRPSETPLARHLKHQPAARRPPEHQTAAQLLPEHYGAAAPRHPSHPFTDQRLPDPPVSQRPPNRPLALEDEIYLLLTKTCTADSQMLETSARLLSEMSDPHLLKDTITNLYPHPTFSVEVLVDAISREKGKYAHSASPSASARSTHSSPNTPSYGNTPRSASAGPSVSTARKSTSSMKPANPSNSASANRRSASTPAETRGTSAPAEAKTDVQSKPKGWAKSASAPPRLQTENLANELKYKYIPNKGWFKLALTYSGDTFQADPVEDAITWRRNKPPPVSKTSKKGKPSNFPAPGDIWMHRNTQNNTVQVWQYSGQKKWVGCTDSYINDDGATSHPKWDTHVLCMGQVAGYIALPVYIQRKSLEKRPYRDQTDNGLGDLAPASGGSDNDVGGSDVGGSDAGGSGAGGSDAGDSGADDVEPLPADTGSGITSGSHHEEEVV